MELLKQQSMSGIEVVQRPSRQYLMTTPQVGQRLASGAFVVKECVIEVAKQDRHRIIDAIRSVNMPYPEYLVAPMREELTAIRSRQTDLTAELEAANQREAEANARSEAIQERQTELNTELGVYFESPEMAQLLSRQFDTEIIQLAYRVELNDNGKLEWVTRKDGRELRFDKEPDTTAWKRFSTRFLSIFVPESQL